MQQGIKLRHKWQWFLLVFWFSAGFPIRVQLVGDILGKMAKNYMKFTKSTFLRQNSGWDIVRKSQFFGNVGGIPPDPPHKGKPCSGSTSHTQRQTQTGHTRTNRLTHIYKYQHYMLHTHNSYLYYTEYHTDTKFFFRGLCPLPFNNCSLVAVICLLIRFKRTMSFVWNTEY